MFSPVISPNVKDVDLFLPTFRFEIVCEEKPIKEDSQLYFTPNFGISSNDVTGILLNNSKIANVEYEASINEYTLPNDSVKSLSIDLCNYFTTKKIDHSIHALADGGIGFEFMQGNTYYNIKVENDGIGTFYKESAGSVPEGWDLSLSQIIIKVKSEF